MFTQHSNITRPLFGATNAADIQNIGVNRGWNGNQWNLVNVR